MVTLKLYHKIFILGTVSWEVMPSPEVIKEEKKEFFTKTRLTIILFVVCFVFLIFLFRANINWLALRPYIWVVVGVLGLIGILTIFRDRFFFMDIPKIVDDIVGKERKRGLLLNPLTNNIIARQVGQFLVLIFFKREAVGYTYNTMYRSYIGKDHRGIFDVMKDIKEQEVVKAFSEGKLKVHPEDI